MSEVWSLADAPKRKRGRPVGSKQSAEARAKISAAHLGKKHSSETRAKISASSPNNKGITAAILLHRDLTHQQLADLVGAKQSTIRGVRARLRFEGRL